MRKKIGREPGHCPLSKFYWHVCFMPSAAMNKPSLAQLHRLSENTGIRQIFEYFLSFVKPTRFSFYMLLLMLLLYDIPQRFPTLEKSNKHGAGIQFVFILSSYFCDIKILIVWKTIKGMKVFSLHLFIWMEEIVSTISQLLFNSLHYCNFIITMN